MSKAPEKATAEAKAQAAESHPTREEIELRAHQIYLERGGEAGRDVEDWLQAELELREEYQKTGLRTRVAKV